MRVLFVTQWFPPEPTRIPATIATTLADNDVDVAVLTGTPNFPTGQVLEGYSARRYQPDSFEGIPVLNAPLYPSHDSSAARRILNYLSWAFSSVLPAVLWRRAASADVTLVYSSPATAALPAMARRALRGTPYVLLVEDLWPDSITATGFFRAGLGKRVAVPLLHRLVSLTYRWAAHIAVISPGMQRVLCERGVPEDRVSIVYNWVRDEPGQPAAAKDGDGTHLVYGGNLGRAQGLDVAIRALAELDDPTVRLTFVGDGVVRDELMALADELVPGRVEFLPRVPLADFQEIARSASALLVCLSDDPLFDITLPSKVQSTLAMGLAVVASAGRDVREVVDRAGAGWTAPAGDVSALAEVLAQVRDAGPDERARRGAAGRSFYERELSEDVNLQRLLSVLRGAAATGRKRSGRSA